MEYAEYSFSAQSVPNAAETNAVLSEVVNDVHGMTFDGTDTITFEEGLKAVITLELYSVANATGIREVYFRFGADHIADFSIPAAVAPYPTVMTTTAVINVTSFPTICNFVIFQDSGGLLDCSGHLRILRVLH